MGKYIKIFDNHSDYNQFIISGQAASPNVSYCMNENEVHYNPEIFVNEYFTTIAREDGTISFNIRFDMGTDMIKSISYSTDNGETWTTTNNTDNKSEHLVIDVNVSKGDKVLWKGDATQLGCWSPNEDVDDVVGSFFSSTCRFDAQGNVMSLLYGDSFKEETTIEKNFAFAFLFYDYNGEKTCEVVNAKNLSLPATTLAERCYSGMFRNCSSLTTAPELPATTLARFCYSWMFRNCTSLITSPELPATTLVQDCYFYMFQDCASLNYIKCLATDISASDCTEDWVIGVSASGMFIKAASMNSWTTGNDGIPNGWTVETASN